jgi:hypothetical protein
MAKRDKKIVVNPLDQILNKPSRGSKTLDTAEACWTTDEVQKLMATAKPPALNSRHSTHSH